jgi:hypothetical protein
MEKERNTSMKKIKGTQVFLSILALSVAMLALGCPPPAGDSTAPTVSAVAPAASAASVAINSNVTATFSEEMAPATIIAANFTLAAGATAVTGVVSYSGTVATFNPASDLAYNTVYTATVKTGATDLAGNALAANKVWTFTTGTMPDTTAPTVASTVPAASATGVSVYEDVTATFSEDMDAATIVAANFTLAAGASAVSGVVSYTGTVASFNPGSALAYNTVYTATVTTGAKDLAGNAMAQAKVWTFTTSALPDTTAPTVITTLPANSATGVATNANLIATFSEPMDASTIIAANFTLAAGASAVTGTVTYNVASHAATFAPSVILTAGTLYTATVTTGVKDAAGNAMFANKVWTFTTTAVGSGPAPVLLGTAGNFVILAKSGISTVPASVITGDVGLSPAAESFMTGFSQTDATGYATSPQVTGFLYAADMAPPTPANMTTAVSDMETAYTDAAGRVTPDFTNAHSGNLGGTSLAPGLYIWTGSVTIPSDVTIAGASNDVWIFQMSGDLSVSSGVSVILSGGAQPKNIFWQVAGQALLGTTSHFEGIILSQTSITLGTGASLNGRILAQTNIALDQATVTEPAF